MGVGKQTRGAERPTRRRSTPETNTSAEDLSDLDSQPPTTPSSASKRPRSSASSAATATSNSRSSNSKRKRCEPENDLENEEKNREAIALRTTRQRNADPSSGSKRKGRSGREAGQNETTNNDPDVSSDPEEMFSRSKRPNTRPKRSTRGTRSAAKVNDDGSDGSDGSSLSQIHTASASSSKKQIKPKKTLTSVSKTSPSLKVGPTISPYFSSDKGKGKPYTAEPAQQPPRGIGVKLDKYFPSNFEEDESSLSEATSEEEEEKIEDKDYENILANEEIERDIEVGYGDDMDEDEDDEEVDWEEVHVPVKVRSEGTSITTPITYKDVHITFEAPKLQLRRPRGITKQDRQVRMLVHQTHLLCLLAHAATRNCWCNSPEIRAYAMSIVPGYVARLLDTGEDTEDAQASHRALIAGIKALVTWWKERYFRITGRGIAMRSWSECARVTNKMDMEPDPDNDHLPTRADLLFALTDTRSGTRDTSAQLFTAVARAAGLEARLVCSLQAVSFRFQGEAKVKQEVEGESEVGSEKEDEEGKTKGTRKGGGKGRGKGKGKGKKKEVDDDDDNEEYADVPIKPPVKLRTRRPKLSPPPDYGASAATKGKGKASNTPNPFTSPHSLPPTFWTEIYSPYVSRWIPVDPIRGFVDQPRQMEPPPSASHACTLAYVVALESDLDGVRDVTRRYAFSWGARTRKLRLGAQAVEEEWEDGTPVKGEKRDWWEETLRLLRRSQRGERDGRENAELVGRETEEEMPKSVAAFNNHPLYALERHLKKFEMLHPREPIVGHIRGEPIYPRSCVKQLHSAETWLKEGRSIVEGQQPVKYVKSRAVTLTKRRVQEMTSLMDDKEPEVGLYGDWQTEEYKPKHVVDNRVPKNHYGDVDLFKPSMLPIGAAHIPFNGVGKIARKLGIDYADAVVGFDFANRKCVPMLKGIVVPKDAERVLLDAWHEHDQHQTQLMNAKREREVYTRWKKVIMGLLVRERLREDYGNGSEDQEVDIEDDEGSADRHDEEDGELRRGEGYDTRGGFAID